MGHGPNKTIQHQLSSGNAKGGNVGACSIDDSALARGSRSTGLGKMVQEPWTRFDVARCRVFCHLARLQSHPARLKQFSLTKSGRQFAAYLGLVPRQNSSGGKDRLGRISKMGNGYLRRLLVVGATSVTRRAPTTDTRTRTWVRSLLERKPTRVVTVAIANKTARTAWALLSKGESYKAVPAI